MTNHGPRKLRDEKWTDSTFDHAVFAWLQAEHHDYHRLQNASLTDRFQNNRRRAKLASTRSQIIDDIPPDTMWYEVQHLRREHFPQLLGINWCGFRSSNHRNEFPAFAEQVKAIKEGRFKPVETDPATWPRLILWGHSMDGPFTVIEGSHRISALCLDEQELSFEIPVYVGISDRGSFRWHLPDGPDALRFRK